MTAADALARGMAAQLRAFHAALDAGMPRAGWKVGFNFPEARGRLGLDGPTVGWLHGGRILASGATWAAASDSNLHVEAEVCLRVGRDVAAGTTAADARAAIVEFAPAIELVDLARSWAGVEAMLAHGIFHEATVLGVGATVPPAGLGTAVPVVRVDGEERAAARADLVPADLGEVIAFVATALAAHGEALRAGDRVISGSFTNPAAAPSGSTVEADFGAAGAVRILIR